MTCCSRLFQKRAAAIGKARSPTVESQVRRTISDDEAERSRDQLVGRVRRWSTAVPTHAGICIRGRQVLSQSVLEPSAYGVDEEPE